MNRKLEKRFHELLVLDCSGKASPVEKRKLAILQNMREQPSDYEKRQIPRLDYQTRQMRKLLRKIEYHHKLSDQLNTLEDTND